MVSRVFLCGRILFIAAWRRLSITMQMAVKCLRCSVTEPRKIICGDWQGVFSLDFTQRQKGFREFVIIY